ncbi:MAG: diguanylate cyclase [Clostridiales bacterium]|nr:diguanylate cyclase [Clostridiales bacterium]
MKEFQLIRYLSKGKFLILIVALIGAVSVYYYANSKQVYTATMAIQYSNTAIKDGLTPNGSKLDVSEIYSSTVIKGAIEDLGLNCSVDAVRSKVKVRAVIPEEEEEKKEAFIKKGEEYSYFPTDYVITYEADSEKSMRYAGNMLDAIIKNYYSFYSEKYVDLFILPNNASNISSNDYDYIESAEIIQQSVKDVDNYLIQKKHDYPDFRASATGYTFTDLENIYSYILNNKVPYIYAKILQKRYTKDNDLLLKNQQEKIDSLTISIDNNTAKVEKLKFLIDNYSQKNINNYTDENGERSENTESSIIMDVDGKDRDLYVTTTYDDLIDEYVLLNQSIENDQIDKKHAEYIKSVFVKNKKNKVLSTDIEKDIEDLVSLLNDEYEIIQATAQELNEYLGASHLNTLNSVVTSQKVNIKLYIALAVVFFLFFGCAGAVVIGRLKDFLEYLIYTDKLTKLPNRQMCDIQINSLAEKQLEEQFTCMIIQVDNLTKVNDTLGRSAGDMMLSDFGEIIKRLSRNYGFIGCNRPGYFLGLYEDCSVSKAKLFTEMLEKSVEDYNKKRVEIQVKYSIAFSNSTEESVYQIRSLIHSASDKMR